MFIAIKKYIIDNNPTLEKAEQEQWKPHTMMIARSEQSVFFIVNQPPLILSYFIIQQNFVNVYRTAFVILT